MSLHEVFPKLSPVKQTCTYLQCNTNFSLSMCVILASGMLYIILCVYTGAGFWGTSQGLFNTSALRASADGDIGTINCHSSSYNSSVGQWISPQGLDITGNHMDPFSIQFNNGPGYPSFNTFQLQDSSLQPFTSTYNGVYSCVVPDDQGTMLTLHIGIYSNQYSSMLISALT